MEYPHVHELWRHWLDQFVHRGCWLWIVEKCLWLLSTCDPFISSFENYIYKLLKILKINLDIVNDVTYIYEKYQCKILCVMGYTKRQIRSTVFTTFVSVVDAQEICRVGTPPKFFIFPAQV
jgi:hypothetical protein